MKGYDIKKILDKVRAKNDDSFRIEVLKGADTIAEKFTFKVADFETNIIAGTDAFNNFIVIGRLGKMDIEQGFKYICDKEEKYFSDLWLDGHNIDFVEAEEGYIYFAEVSSGVIKGNYSLAYNFDGQLYTAVGTFEGQIPTL